MLFTVVVELSLNEGDGPKKLSVAQISSPSLDRVVSNWIQYGDLEDIGLKQSDRKLFYEDETFDKSLIPLQGLKNAWVGSDSVNEELFLVNVFLKPKQISVIKDLEREKILYSFYVSVGGGTYISQYEAFALIEASELFLGSHSPWKDEFAERQLSKLDHAMQSRSLKFNALVGNTGVFSLDIVGIEPRADIFCIVTQK